MNFKMSSHFTIEIQNRKKKQVQVFKGSFECSFNEYNNSFNK